MRVRILSINDVEPLLSFELANKAWFEQHIDARPSWFYSNQGVASHIEELLHASAINEAFPGIIEENEEIIGRVNLTKIERTKKAKLGYRVGKNSTGRGVASFGVAQVLKQVHILGAQSVCAFVSLENLSSQRVLRKHGFRPVDRHADYAKVAGRLLTCIEYEWATA